MVRNRKHPADGRCRRRGRKGRGRRGQRLFRLGNQRRRRRCLRPPGAGLEESEFEPFFSELEGSLSGKKVVLFGSYDWGDGQWMRDWQQRTVQAGAQMPADGLIVNLTPDEDGLAQCRELGARIAE